jgi:hypothetical protein
MIGRLKVYAALIGLFITTLAATWFSGKMTGAANFKARASAKESKAMKRISDETQSHDPNDDDANLEWLRKRKPNAR